MYEREKDSVYFHLITQWMNDEWKMCNGIYILLFESLYFFSQC